MLPFLAAVLAPAIITGGQALIAAYAARSMAQAARKRGIGMAEVAMIPDPYAPLRGEEGVSFMLSKDDRRDAQTHLGCVMVIANGKSADASLRGLIEEADTMAQDLGAKPYADLRKADKENRKRFPTN